MCAGLRSPYHLPVVGKLAPADRHKAPRAPPTGSIGTHLAQSAQQQPLIPPQVPHHGARTPGGLVAGLQAGCAISTSSIRTAVLLQAPYPGPKLVRRAKGSLCGATWLPELCESSRELAGELRAPASAASSRPEPVGDLGPLCAGRFQACGPTETTVRPLLQAQGVAACRLLRPSAGGGRVGAGEQRPWRRAPLSSSWPTCTSTQPCIPMGETPAVRHDVEWAGNNTRGGRQPAAAVPCCACFSYRTVR